MPKRILQTYLMKHAWLLFMEQYVEVPTSEWAAIEPLTLRVVVKKGERILEQGAICEHLWLLEKGTLRYLSTDDLGMERSKFFTLAPYCFTSSRSFDRQIPSDEAIEALEPSVVWQMTKADADALTQYPSWNLFIRKLLLEVQSFTEALLLDTQSKTAAERYMAMLEQGSPLLKKVPIKYMASYLGIAPQSLSRIRRQAMGF
jgi:CRP/FNR family transcriptional regulator, anaerobic regulatory protein